jgi:hypothetical protein
MHDESRGVLRNLGDADARDGSGSGSAEVSG